MTKCKESILLISSVGAFVVAENKEVILKGDIKKFAKIREQLEMSTAPHNEVKASLEWMDSQIFPQIDTSTIKK